MTRASALVAGGGPAIAGASGKGSDAVLEAGGRSLVTILLFLAVALIFLVSPMALLNLGVHYGETGGSLIEKIHPGTWVASSALLLAALGRGNPFVVLDEIAAKRGVAIFLASWILLFVYSGLVRKVPATPFIDTFLLPIILLLLIDATTEREKRALAILVHVVMAANAALAIYEYLSGFRLTPQVEAMGTVLIDWRSTALFGHPLANASMAGAYALALCIGGGRDMAALLRPFAIVLQLVAMVTFGGRAALVVTLALLAGVALANLVRISRGARLDVLPLALVCLALPFVAAAAIAAAQAGFFDQMLDRFVSDRGSASTRIIMFKLFDMLPLRDILLGPDLRTLASLQYLEGINYGIESFWISFILTDGLAISLIFFAGLGALCHELVRTTRPATLLLLFSFFAVASTSVSLSAKTPLFAMFVVLVLILMRAEAGGAKALAGARR